MAAKKRPLSDGESTPKAKRGRPKLSQVLTRYPPLKDTGEDHVTLGRNIELLHKELDNQRPRKEVVLTLAAQTYSSRREAVLSESEIVTATSLLETYSELKKSYVVSKQANVL